MTCHDLERRVALVVEAKLVREELCVTSCVMSCARVVRRARDVMVARARARETRETRVCGVWCVVAPHAGRHAGRQAGRQAGRETTTRQQQHSERCGGGAVARGELHCDTRDTSGACRVVVPRPLAPPRPRPRPRARRWGGARGHTVHRDTAAMTPTTNEERHGGIIGMATAFHGATMASSPRLHADEREDVDEEEEQQAEGPHVHERRVRLRERGPSGARPRGTVMSRWCHDDAMAIRDGDDDSRRRAPHHVHEHVALCIARPPPAAARAPHRVHRRHGDVTVTSL